MYYILRALFEVVYSYLTIYYKNSNQAGGGSGYVQSLKFRAKLARELPRLDRIGVSALHIADRAPCHGSIVISVPVLRIETDGLIEVCYRLLVVVEAQVGIAARIVGVGEIRFEAEGLAQLRNRFPHGVFGYQLAGARLVCLRGNTVSGLARLG